VRLFAGEPEGEPAAIAETAVDGTETFSFGGHAPGRYTVWIDLGDPTPPLVLRRVDLRAGVTDLGTRPAPPGGSVRVRVLVPDGQAMPAIRVEAHRTTEPSYERHEEARTGDDVVVHGLGPGRFRVTATFHGERRPRLDETIESDGASEIVLTLDLR
jgi:hypothetical protein